MEQEPFLSIVMPVYRVEKHLEKAVNSILNQDFKDWELILVDDCSPDASGQIADSLAGGDERIRVIHLPENLGVCAARNHGIEAARGTYITFVDSDDTLDDSAYQAVYDKIVQLKTPDVVLFGAREIYYTTEGQIKKERSIIPQSADCLSAEAVHTHVVELDRQTLYGYVWNKVYRKSVLDGYQIRFDTRYSIQEDFLFNADFFDHVSSMAILDRDFYRYAKRPSGSATGSFIEDYYKVHMMRIERLADQLEGWQVLDEGARSHLARTYTRYVFSAFARNMNPRSGMDAAARKAFMHQVFESPLYARMMPYAACSGGIFGVLERFLKMGSIPLCTVAATAIRRVRGI